jgi:hypothetical protein
VLDYILVSHGIDRVELEFDAPAGGTQGSALQSGLESSAQDQFRLIRLRGGLHRTHDSSWSQQVPPAAFDVQQDRTALQVTDVHRAVEGDILGDLSNEPVRKGGLALTTKTQPSQVDPTVRLKEGLDYGAAQRRAVEQSGVIRRGPRLLVPCPHARQAGEVRARSLLRIGANAKYGLPPTRPLVPGDLALILVQQVTAIGD